MARYIDADALIEDFTYCGADEGLIKEIIHRINLNPTADVVPKSEVEKIFEKIEGFFKRYENDEYYYVDHIEYDIADLKKKYTESEDTK